MNDVTVVIPTIPVRKVFFNKTLDSVQEQTYAAKSIISPMDIHREGAAKNRQHGLDSVRTPWVTFIDDDDWMLPTHIESLMNAALEQEADFVFSWYHVRGGTDPRAEEFGLPWDPENPRQTTIVTLIKTELAQSVGFVSPVETSESLRSPDRHYAGEDYYMTKGCNDLGAKIYHLPEKTWFWRHHGNNTSGLPQRW